MRLASEPTADLVVNLEAALRAPGQSGDLLFELAPISVGIPHAQWQSPVSLTLRTTDNRLANPDQIVDIRIVNIVSNDPIYVAQTAAPVAVEVTDRGAYGLQEIPVNRWLPWLALIVVLSGLLALPRIGRSA